MKKQKKHEFKLVVRSSVNEEVVHAIFASCPDQLKHRLETFLYELRIGDHKDKINVYSRPSNSNKEQSVKVSFVQYLILQHKNKSIDCEITGNYDLFKFPSSPNWKKEWFKNAFNMTQD